MSDLKTRLSALMIEYHYTQSRRALNPNFSVELEIRHRLE